MIWNLVININSLWKFFENSKKKKKKKKKKKNIYIYIYIYLFNIYKK